MFHANGWGMPFGDHRRRRPARRAAPGRRHRDPAPRRAARRHADVRGAGRGQRRARRRRDAGTARSPAATGCGSSSPAPRRRPAPSSGCSTSSAGSSSRSTASPRPRRWSRSTGMRAEWDDLEPHEQARNARPGRRARARRAGHGRRRRRGAHRVEPQPRRLLGAARGDRASAQAGNWFHTGDGGYLDDDGYLVISDRKKDVIISGGENVSSIEVEDALMSHPRGQGGRGDRHPRREVGRAGHRAGRHATAPTVDRGGPHRALPRARWPATSARSAIEFVDELPRTATGKLQKFKLREPFWAGHERQVN